ncbi:MAG: hypothetical protein JSU93_01300 [Methanobacteriota archaeon]|nr:MAG: hypothetical protein JSU93_01300 [Euryarchaeota archaeon]
MNALLGVLIGSAVFALLIFLIDRSAKYIALVGVAVVAIALVAVLLGVGD